jgi:broad-specificity NMP kinase
MVTGLPLNGKTTVCKLLEKHFGLKVIDLVALEAAIKKSKGTEEEPYEGTISEYDMIGEMVKMM